MGRLYQFVGILCVYFAFHYVWQECKGLKYRKALIVAVLAQLLFVLIGYKHISAPLLTYLFIGGIGIPAIIIGMMYDPNILLIAAALYLPFNLLLPGTFGGFAKAFNLTNVILVALFISLFVAKKQNTGRVYSTSRSVMAFLAAYLVLSLMAYVKGSLYHGINYLTVFIFPVKRWLTPVIVFYFFYKLVKGRDIIKIIFSILLLTVVVNIYFGLLEWVNLGFGTYSDIKHRIGGINMHPNFYGAFLAYYLGLVAGPCLTTFRKTAGKFLIFPALLGLRIIIPTNSRGAWMGLAAALPVFSFFRSKLTMLFFILGVSLLFIFPDLMPTTVRMRFQEGMEHGRPAELIYTQPGPETILSESKSISVRTRWLLWEAGLELAKENIWFGSGWGVFPFRIGDYNHDLTRASAHNIWLQILCEMGLLTLVALFLMLALLFKSAVYVLRREQDPMLQGMALGFLAAIPAIIVANLTGNRFDAEEVMFHFWILAACLLQLKNIIQTERFKEEFSVK